MQIDVVAELCPDNSAMLKKAAVGQCLMQMVKARGFMPPILFGLGVQLQHQFASRFLIDTLNNLGFSISYTEVMNFLRSAAFANKDIIKQIDTNQFLQFTADNVDHQTITLDGHGTFHGMGLICALAPNNDQSKRRRIPRLKKISSEESKEMKGIDIHFWDKNIDISHCYYNSRDLPEATSPSDFDLLWKFAWSKRPSRPGWTECMQMVSENTGPGKASIMFLPMLDLNPSQ
jgi:hypothetical protein